MESSESGSMQSSSGGDDQEPYSSHTIPNSAVLVPPQPPQSHPFLCHTYPSSIHPAPDHPLLDTWPRQRSDDLVPSSSTHTHPRGATRTANTVIGVKTTKKRSRASRRAPTTVLTTNTANFRAMVQEFTGIPAYVASPFHRAARVDSVGTTSSLLMAANSLPSYLLRPFAQKIQQPSSLLPPSPQIAAFDAAKAGGTVTSTAGSSRSGYVHLLKHPQEVALANASMELPTTISAETSSNLKLSVMEELRLIHAAQLSSAHQTTAFRRNDSQGQGEASFVKSFTGNYNVS